MPRQYETTDELVEAFYRLHTLARNAAPPAVDYEHLSSESVLIMSTGTVVWTITACSRRSLSTSPMTSKHPKLTL